MLGIDLDMVGTAMAWDAGWTAAVVVGFLVLVLVALTGRRWMLRRRWATFECSVRAPRGWSPGVGAYGDGVLRWYRLFSVRMRPSLTLDRRELALLGRRQPAGGESRSLMRGHVVVAVESAEQRLELAMCPEAVMSLTAWVETASRV